MRYSLVADEFDMSFFQDKALDHGCFSPLSMLCPHEPKWPTKLIPLLDSNNVSGLVHNSRNSDVPGRYVFPVRSGGAATGHQIGGNVVHDATSQPISGASLPWSVQMPVRVWSTWS